MEKADVTKMTRAQGERAVAATTDLETLKLLGDHKNGHVRAKANYKYRALLDDTHNAAVERECAVIGEELGS